MLIVSCKAFRCFGPASVAVDALVVDVKLPGLVVWPLF